MTIESISDLAQFSTSIAIISGGHALVFQSVAYAVPEVTLGVVPPGLFQAVVWGGLTGASTIVLEGVANQLFPYSNKSYADRKMIHFFLSTMISSYLLGEAQQAFLTTLVAALTVAKVYESLTLVI